MVHDPALSALQVRPGINSTATSASPLLSMAMIARDEEDSIGYILEDAQKFCDELVVVDTGSMDSTPAIAAAHGATVCHFEWIDDFSAARNFALSQCKGEWIVILDADDRVPPDAQEGFRGLVHRLHGRTDIDGVLLPYHYAFSETDPNVCTFSHEAQRVLRRAAHLTWMGRVHEIIAFAPGRDLHSNEAWVDHRPSEAKKLRRVGRNLAILEHAVASGDRRPRTLFYFGNELRDNERFEDALRIYEQYVAVSDLAWEKYVAFIFMADCAKALKKDEEELGYLAKALAFDSRRADAFMRFGLHFYDRQQWDRALPFFAAVTTLTRPQDGFVNDADYTWLPWDYLAVCESNLGKVEQALEHTMKALIGSPDRERQFANIRYFLDEINARTR